VKVKYRQLGGHLKVIVKEGAGHFDALPADPAPIVNFIVAAQHGGVDQRGSGDQHGAGSQP
jgi:hypothetical protein